MPLRRVALRRARYAAAASASHPGRVRFSARELLSSAVNRGPGQCRKRPMKVTRDESKRTILSLRNQRTRRELRFVAFFARGLLLSRVVHVRPTNGAFRRFDRNLNRFLTGMCVCKYLS